MPVKLCSACEGQGSPAGSSYTLYVELLTYYSVPLIDAQRRVYRAEPCHPLNKAKFFQN